MASSQTTNNETLVQEVAAPNKNQERTTQQLILQLLKALRVKAMPEIDLQENNDQTKSGDDTTKKSNGSQTNNNSNSKNKKRRNGTIL